MSKHKMAGVAFGKFMFCMLLITDRKANRTWFLIWLLLLAFVGYAQQKQERDNAGVIKLNTNLVSFNATVLSKKTGKIITGLRKEDFILFDEGVRQEITHFTNDEHPLSVIILIDDSGSVRSILDEIHDEGRQTLRNLKPEDEIALMAFSSTAWLVWDFTLSKKEIIERIAPEKLFPLIGVDNIDFSGSGTHIADSIYLAAKHFDKATNPPGRRSIIVITDDWANDTIYSEEEVTNQLFESGVTVYGLIIGGRHIFDRYIIPMSFGKNGGNATTYANKTGGVALNGRGNKAAENLTRIISLLRQQYSFGYVPTNSQMDGKFRKINLKVTPEIEKREGRVTILTRQGYYARPRNAR
ncbi:MAG: VWA domain-containing protein [Acidobacteriota bacterium]|nr:VWA domain-containing protein [Acidobacteriota bacterium]